VNFSAAGTYVFRYTANDSALVTSDDVQVKVLAAPPVNKAPVVYAGRDMTITLPATATLNATVNDDGLPGSTSGMWTWTSSGSDFLFMDDYTATSQIVSIIFPGVYILSYTASDGELSASDDVKVTVLAAPAVNQAPVVNAGSDMKITLPATATLNATVQHDGIPGPTTTGSWTQVSPTNLMATFDNKSSLSPKVNFSAAGTYVFRYTASDSALVTSDDVQVKVLAAPPVNQAPVVNAVSDQSVTLERLPNGTTSKTINLQGSATDDNLPLGRTLTYTWKLVSWTRPQSYDDRTVPFTFSASTSPTTNVTFTQAGTYLFRLVVSDGALSPFRDVRVTVAPDPEFQKYLDYKAGNHGQFEVLSYEDYTNILTSINMNTPVPGYYTTYRQSAGSQALTLVDWFRLNQDEIRIKCLADSIPQEDFDTSEVLNPPSSKSMSDFFNSNLDLARLPSTKDIDIQGDNLAYGRHGMSFEYEFPPQKTDKYPVPNTPFLFWAEFKQIKVSAFGSYTKEVGRDIGDYNLSTRFSASGAAEAKFKIGRDCSFKSANWRYYDAVKRKTFRNYFRVKMEVVAEAVFSDNLFFNYYGMRFGKDFLTTQAPFTWSLGFYWQGRFEVGGYPLRIVVEDVTEVLNPVSEMWTEVSSTGFHAFNFEAGVKGSLSWDSLSVKYINNRGIKNPEAETLGDGSWILVQLGQVTGAVQVVVKVKVNNAVVAKYEYSPLFGTLLNGMSFNVRRITGEDLDVHAHAPPLGLKP
jgi:hypothetical protein